MNAIELPGAIEPDIWNVVFHRKGANRFLEFLCFGEFKHVSAFAYCAGFRAWLVYDTELLGTRLRLLPHNPRSIATLTGYMRGNVTLTIGKEFEPKFSLAARAGFYCVPAIKHLLGVHCRDPRPDGLYRAILKAGGKPIHESAVSPAIAA